MMVPFIRMSRRKKIACACALVFAVTLAVWFWPNKYHDALNIEFAGAAAGDSNIVSFTITNRSKTGYALIIVKLTFPSNGHWEELDIRLPNPNVLPGHGSTICSDRVYPLRRTHRWRLAVGYSFMGDDSRISRVRWSLGEHAHKLGWERIGEWVRPREKWRYAYGPEMLGHRPAAPASR
jgi:hypothetical protein